MGSITDRWRVHFQSPVGPVLSGEMVVRASSLSDAVRHAQPVVDAAGSEIVEVEKVRS